MQVYNSYLHEIDTVSNHLIIVRPLSYVCIENMPSYMVVIVRAIYSYLANSHLMAISLCVCGLTAFILIQLTLVSYLDPCLVKTNVKFVSTCHMI